MADEKSYASAVEAIKTAILQSQAASAQGVNSNQLALYYAIGGYVSANTRKGFWGTGALKAISDGLKRDMPGLRGFSERQLYYMRTFYEEWSGHFGLGEADTAISALASAEMAPEEFGKILHLQVQNCDRSLPEGFLDISFTHHRTILEQVKPLDERLFYIREAAERRYSVDALKEAIRDDDFHHQGSLPNNFLQALTPAEQAFKAVRMFKDEYFLDYLNTEELGARDRDDVDERLLEQGIVHNIRDFILKFGQNFTFVGNQYRIEALGEEQFIDLLFFNRELNCLVAVELKCGPFKTAYLGQLNGYLSLLDGFVKKPHENPSIGLVLCKDVNRSFADYVIRDYDKPLGVATYKTSKDMPRELMDALPPVEDLRALLDGEKEE